MPIVPAAPFPKHEGDNIRSADWNQAVNEVIRLDNAKLNVTGGHITGPLQLDGPLGVGTATPTRIATFRSPAGTYINCVSDLGGGPFEVLVGADGAGGIVSTMTNHDLQLRAGGNSTKVLVRADGNVGIGTGAPNSKLHVAGDVRLDGQLLVPTTQGLASFLHNTFSNEGDFVANNLKLSMGTQGLIIVGGLGLQYQFVIGHEFRTPILGGGTTFIRKFSIDHNGNAFFAGSKGGFVIDYFLYEQGAKGNLEQGDVVVLNAKSVPAGYYGTHDNIPIPVVERSKRAYDTRICGIVAEGVAAHDLPTIDPKPDATEEQLKSHPLAKFGASAEGQPFTEVRPGQIGRMVTLGAFAHCKVDADISPIECGDLLAASDTPGHAQKVKDASKGLGAILGKALAPLGKGKGKIPVLVTLQ
jgi:hypothetical protein